MEKYFDNTHILLSRKISTKLYIILWSFFIALAIYLLANLSFLNVIFLILSLFVIVIISLYFKSFNYFFTTKNIIFEKGIFYKKIVFLDFSDWSKVLYKQNLIGKIFNFGSVYFISKNENKLRWIIVPNPKNTVIIIKDIYYKSILL